MTSWELRYVELPMFKMNECIKTLKETEPPFSDIPVSPYKNICFGGEKGKTYLFDVLIAI